MFVRSEARRSGNVSGEDEKSGECWDTNWDTNWDKTPERARNLKKMMEEGERMAGR